MSNIVLQSSAGGSGAVTIAAPETNTPLAYQLPKSSGKVSVLSASSAVALSGTSVAFTGIPDDARRITVLFDAMSTNGTSEAILQLGTSGGYVTSGYEGVTGITSTAAGAAAVVHVSGFNLDGANEAATTLRYGKIELNRLSPSSNKWVFTITAGFTVIGYGVFGGGVVDVGGTLDRIRLTTEGGADLLDNGTASIIVE